MKIRNSRTTAAARNAAAVVALGGFTLLSGCATGTGVVGDAISCLGAGENETKTDTFSDPALKTTDIQSVAVFPIGSQNSPIGRTEAKKLNRELVKLLRERNPDIELIGSNQIVDTINEAGMMSEYNSVRSAMLGAAIPNQSALERVGDALGADALVQVNHNGLSRFYNEDGGFLSSGGEGTVDVSLAMTGTEGQSRKLLWEGNAETTIVAGCFGEEPPTTIELMRPGLQATSKSFPKL